MHELSRRTVIAGAAWSVPVIAVAVATPLAAASGAFSIDGAFSAFTRVDGQFRGTFVVTTSGGPVPESGVTVSFAKNGSGVAITPPAGWVQQFANADGVSFAPAAPLVTPFTYSFEYAVDEKQFASGVQSLDAYIDTPDVSLLQSMSFGLGVRAYWSPVTTFGGSYYATYFAQDLTGGVPADAFAIVFDYPASTSVEYAGGHGIELGAADSDARLIQHLHNDGAFDISGYVDIRIDGGSVAGSDSVVATLIRSGTSETVVDTLQLEGAAAAAELTPAWSGVTTIPDPDEDGGFRKASTLSVLSSAPVPSAGSLVVELTGWLEAAATFTANSTWRQVRGTDLGDGRFAIAYLFVGDYSTPPTIRASVRADYDPGVSGILARVILTGRLVGEYPIQLN